MVDLYTSFVVLDPKSLDPKPGLPMYFLHLFPLSTHRDACDLRE